MARIEALQDCPGVHHGRPELPHVGFNDDADIVSSGQLRELGVVGARLFEQIPKFPRLPAILASGDPDVFRANRRGGAHVQFRVGKSAAINCEICPEGRHGHAGCLCARLQFWGALDHFRRGHGGAVP